MASAKLLVISVDTEEEGLWGGNYRVRGNATENLRGLPRFQSECERLSAPPTYLIDAPVVMDAEAMERLRCWQDAGMCEVGSHCHPWCSPPISCEAPTSGQTYLCNLPPEVQHEKMSWLTERIADAVGQLPTSFRAGRYGFNRSTADVLEQLGYRVDSSVIPLYEYVSEGGPDFTSACRFPFRYFGDDDQRGLIEIPVTVGFARAGYDQQRSLWMGIRREPWRRLRLPGIADRLGVARRVKLTPEGTRLSDLKRLIDACSRDGLTTLVLMLHSSSLVAGLSPYARNEEQLESFYDRFSGAVQYAVSEHGYRVVTLTQAASEASTSNVQVRGAG